MEKKYRITNIAPDDTAAYTAGAAVYCISGAAAVMAASAGNANYIYLAAFAVAGCVLMAASAVYGMVSSKEKGGTMPSDLGESRGK